MRKKTKVKGKSRGLSKGAPGHCQAHHLVEGNGSWDPKPSQTLKQYLSEY